MKINSKYILASIFIIGIIYLSLYTYAVLQEGKSLQKCEEQGLGLVYPPFDGFKWKASSYCANITELNKTHKIKQAPVSRWWYFED